MTKHTEEFKKKVSKEALEVGNNNAIARKYEISELSIRTWIKKYCETPQDRLVNDVLKNSLGVDKNVKELRNR